MDYEHRETLLRVENVSLTLGGSLILRDVNVTIQDVYREGFTTGQVVGFLGPSGIGKTQFSRILAGLQQPTTGTVMIGPNGGQPAHAGLVGYVTQNYLLFSHRTVLGNLVIAGRQTGQTQKAATEKAMWYLERFGLADRARFYPTQLSGGQRQRVAILQQLMCSEHYLVMDEPFSGLDVIMLEKVVELIQEVASQDEFNTIIVITHDVTAAALVADTLWLMGRDRDAHGAFIPGARIHTIFDLAAMGFAWSHDLAVRPEFREFVYQVKREFKEV